MPVKADILDALTALGALGFGWNGSEGLPLRPDVMDYGNILFNPLPSIGIPAGLLERAGMPELVMNQDGTVIFIFAKQTKRLAVTIECGGVLSYFKTFEDGQTEIEGRIRSVFPVWKRCPQELENLLDWYCQE